MKNFLVLLLKGFAVGLGKIIPGVSGALIAIMLKIYEPLLESFVNLKKDFWNNSKFLANLGIGLILAIILGSKVMLYILSNYRLPAIFLFVGIIFSGTVSLFKEVKNSTLNDKIVSGIIVVLMMLLSFIEFDKVYINDNLIINFIMYFISGIFDALASIIPGISGTAILMSLGTYEDILMSLGTVLDISSLSINILVLIPFFLGILIGVYYVSKFITYVLKKHRIKSYFCIIGFSFVSVLILLKQTLSVSYSFPQYIVSIILLIVGYVGSKIMNI